LRDAFAVGEPVLEKVIVRAELHRLDGAFGRALAGDENDGDTGVDLLDFLVGLEAVKVGELEVEEHYVGALAGRGLEAPRGGDGRGQREVGRRREDFLENRQDRRLIVDREQQGHPRSLATGRIDRSLHGIKSRRRAKGYGGNGRGAGADSGVRSVTVL